MNGAPTGIHAQLQLIAIGAQSPASAINGVFQVSPMRSKARARKSGL
jgi:hypothetical protein